MADGFVKEPAVVTRKDFSTAGMSASEVERLKLEDGIRLHEGVKVDLETYAREAGQVSQPRIAAMLGIRQTASPGGAAPAPGPEVAPAFSDPREAEVARITYEVIRGYENRPQTVPTVAHLARPEVQA
ncbi:MAG: hypothetical protein FJ087_14965 [Deltaproteobacteria bacterium]|nr:hypothetical protein [Deltaproteobacteria bacterium]